MVVGIYSDLHCNISAFDALFQVRKHADIWVCAGDTVGLFPFVNEVVDRQRELSPIAVKGDHEISLVYNNEIIGSYTGNQSIEFQRDTINDINKEYIENLPLEIKFECGGIKFCVRHGLHNLSLQNKKYNLDFYSWDLESSDLDVLIVGHTHIPVSIEGKYVRLLNPGSLGFPLSKSRKPSALLFDTKSQKVNYYTFEIDKTILCNEIINAGYNYKLYNFVKNDFNWPK